MSTEKTAIENTENKTAEPAKDELSDQALDKVSGGERPASVSSENSPSLRKDVEILRIED